MNRQKGGRRSYGNSYDALTDRRDLQPRAAAFNDTTSPNLTRVSASDRDAVYTIRISRRSLTDAAVGTVLVSAALGAYVVASCLASSVGIVGALLIIALGAVALALTTAQMRRRRHER